MVHRDLKPGNVLVVEEDGRPVPKVIDFGVAKLLADPVAPSGASAGGLARRPQATSRIGVRYGDPGLIPR